AGLNLVLESGMSLTLKVGGNFINISQAGIAIQAALLAINSGGAPGVGAGAMLQPPMNPEEADKGEPGEMVAPPEATPPPKGGRPSPQAAGLRQAAKGGFPFCEKCAAAAYAAAIAGGASEEEARAAADAAGRAGARAETSGAAADTVGRAGAGGGTGQPAADRGEYWRAPSTEKEKTFIA